MDCLSITLCQSFQVKFTNIYSDSFSFLEIQIVRNECEIQNHLMYCKQTSYLSNLRYTIGCICEDKLPVR